MADKREQLLLDSGLPITFFDLLADLNIGLRELCVITIGELEEALQLASLDEGYVWNTQQIFGAIVPWRHRNQIELHNLLDCENNLPKTKEIKSENERHQESDEVHVGRKDCKGDIPSTEINNSAAKSSTETPQCTLSCELLNASLLSNASGDFSFRRHQNKESIDTKQRDIASSSERSSGRDPSTGEFVTCPIVPHTQPRSFQNSKLGVSTGETNGHHYSGYVTLKASGDNAFPIEFVRPGQQLCNKDKTDLDCCADRSEVAEATTLHSSESEIIPANSSIHHHSPNPSSNPTSSVLSIPPGDSVPLTDITNIGQRSSDRATVDCSSRSAGVNVVNENTVRKLFSPSVLHQLLNSSELGKDIVRRSEIGELSTGRQHELAGIVGEWHLANKARLLQEDLEEYATTIKAVFKSERKETYYLEKGGTKRNPGGIIYNKICNLKTKARKRDKTEAEYAKRIRTGSVETKNIKVTSLSMNWLMLNEGPWGTVLDKWKESFESRSQFVGKSTAEQNLRKKQIWKHFQHEFGYQLFDVDFELKYPTARNGMLVWDGLLIHITDYLKVHVSDEYSIRILHDLTEVPELTEDSRLCAILILLNCVLPPVRVTPGYKPTVSSAQEETILFDQTEQGAKQKLLALYARFKDLGLPHVPKLIALGANYKDLQGSFFVCYGELSYKLSCMKRAVDVFIKLTLTLGLQHSKFSKLVWLFVVRCVYGVYVPEKYSSIEKLVIHLNNVQNA
ncbi:uncharacterized protein LOC110676769 [Aedes aegypti]|uniref:Uncharacterized protein n=1 Tax=Aedes aegypti TaxID=7159 RepID=A0A6I8U8Q9_AEDAE|nr:uncharacterized protein LOC110676653 [Aedes aegypti]XP_021701615.1 uncharacterized protein LOC110676769 [Aedes aegypti]